MTNSKQHIQQQELKSKLDSYGYSQHWKLLKSKDIPKLKSVEYHDFFDRIMAQTSRPSCQNIDLIIPQKSRLQSDQHQLNQFLKIIGTEISKSSLNSLSSQLEQVDTTTTVIRQDNLKREYDYEKRAFRIQEFIRTEQSYVEILQTLVRFVVRPLRAIMQQKHCILNTFKCSKIFLNIEQITTANEEFLKDLVDNKKNLQIEGFGTICEKHIENFECYRKYLLEQADAQQLHTKEFKVNQSYRKFLLKVKDRSEFKRKRLQDILVEPVQRISRYSMMLKEILCLTPEEHPDYDGLKAACEKAKTIATMADDNPTKIATLFLNLYQTIKDSPCSLINQKRSLIAHLDAVEIHRVTNRPTRAVTLFLFTDKILVASKSSIDAKEINIHDFLTSSQQQKMSFNNNNKRRDLNLKFKSWADLESIELFNGPPDRLGSFILSASTTQEVKGGNMGITSFEKYFYKGPRLFSVLPVKKDPRHKMNDYLEKSKDFIHQYQMSRALARQYKPGDHTFHRQWQDIQTYCNVYNPESYIQAKYKNCCTLIYIDNDEELEKLFHNKNNLIFPWTVGLIQPDTKGFRFLLSHKPGIERPAVNTTCEQTLDFESVFWNNLIFLDACLKNSVEFKERQHFYIQQGLKMEGLPIRRSRSMTRYNGGAISKLFNNAENKRKSMVVEDLRPRLESISKSVTPSRSLPSNSVIQQHEESRGRAPIHSWSSPHTPKRESPSPSLSLELNVETKKGFIKTDIKHETLKATEPNSLYGLSDGNIATISSIGSSSQGSTGSCRSSFSAPDEKEDRHTNTVPEDKDYTITSLEPTMNQVFKLTRTFEDEMQQQWYALTAKYELATDDHPFDIVNNDINKDPLLRYSYHRKDQ